MFQICTCSAYPHNLSLRNPNFRSLNIEYACGFVRAEGIRSVVIGHREQRRLEFSIVSRQSAAAESKGAWWGGESLLQAWNSARMQFTDSLMLQE